MRLLASLINSREELSAGDGRRYWQDTPMYLPERASDREKQVEATY